MKANTKDDSPIAYKGELDVEDGDFILDADRLIVRGDEISFSLSGSDDSGDYSIEGIAKKNDDGIFMSPKLKLVYRDFVYKGVDHATVQFYEVMQTAQKSRCSIKGKFKQDDDTWLFWGNIGKYKA